MADAVRETGGSGGGLRIPTLTVGRLGWLSAVGRWAVQGAALETQLKVEQAERVALEEAFVDIGLDLPDLQGLVRFRTLLLTQDL